jgi:hypothetical protein
VKEWMIMKRRKKVIKAVCCVATVIATLFQQQQQPRYVISHLNENEINGKFAFSRRVLSPGARVYHIVLWLFN